MRVGLTQVRVLLEVVEFLGGGELSALRRYATRDGTGSSICSRADAGPYFCYPDRGLLVGHGGWLGAFPRGTDVVMFSGARGS